VTNSPLRIWIIWVVTTVTALTTMYEAAALLTGVTTISTALRTLAETHHHVYTFAGILCGFLFVASLTGWNFPLIVRAAILGWIFVFGHIFWGFC
jgi:hypothetical protein